MANEDNPDPRQWIPIYGIYRALKDSSEQKPSISRGMFENPMRYWGSAIYHSVFLGVGFGGLFLGLEKLLK